MAYENLLKSVEESAQEREAELREKALKAVEGISLDTKSQVLALQQSLLADSKRAATVEKNKLIYLTKGEVKEKLIKAKETIFLRAFGGAEQRLKNLRNDSKYPAILKKLTQEAIGALGGEIFRIHIDKRDEKLIKKILLEMKLEAEVKTDSVCTGGIIVSTMDESVKISNTFESRLERAKEQKKLEVYTMLFGD